MDKLLSWIKANAKDGTNIAEAEELIENNNPLNGISSRDDGLALIMSNKQLKAALDEETRVRVEKHDEKFTKDKLPGLVKEEREKIMKDLNPELTDEQKENAELKRRLDDRDKKDARRDLEAKLRNKAKELESDPLKAERFAIYGDKAEEMLVKEVEDFNTSVKTAVDAKVKGLYADVNPKRTTVDAAKIMKRVDYDKLRETNPEEAASFFRDGGILQD